MSGSFFDQTYRSWGDSSLAVGAPRTSASDTESGVANGSGSGRDDVEERKGVRGSSVKKSKRGKNNNGETATSDDDDENGGDNTPKGMSSAEEG